jgi:NADPH2:quinone reductase
MTQTMMAWRSHQAGGPESLLLEEVTIPAIAGTELLVRVQAVGVNFPDSLFLRDLYQIKPPRPLIPGSEFSGVVVDAGPEVTGFSPGDAVIGRCGWGAMAQYIGLPQDRCIRRRQSMPPIEASAFLFAYATAYHALVDQAQIKPGDKLLVLGAAGGVGSAAVDIGQAMGARVYACASSRSRLDHALASGASAGLVYPHTLATGQEQKALADAFKALVPGGADVIVDPVGGAYTEPALRCLARAGRHLVIGFTAGIPRVPLNLTLLKSTRIIGVDWRTFAIEASDANARNVATLLDLWEAGRIAPRVTEQYPFNHAPAAIARLESRQALGKIAVTMED